VDNVLITYFTVKYSSVSDGDVMSINRPLLLRTWVSHSRCLVAKGHIYIREFRTFYEKSRKEKQER